MTNKIYTRDYYVGAESKQNRLFYERPLRRLAKWVILFFKIISYRKANKIYLLLRKQKVVKNKSFARNISKYTKSAYIPGFDYFELQIGNDTRCASIVNVNEVFQFENRINTNNDFIFGVAPLIDDYNPNIIKEWKAIVKIEEINTSKSHEFSINIPYGARNDFCVYFPGDGWIDMKLSLSDFVGKKCRITIRFETTGNNSGNDVGGLAISNPQIIEKHPVQEAKNVLVISVESLTDIIFLQDKYKFNNLPNIQKLADESISYPTVYSPVDNTLSFAASILTGLMASQHGIGNYSYLPHRFENDRINDNVTPLPEYFKNKKFLTFFGGTQVRFSSKIGYARGFDHYLHVFEKWSTYVPGFNWLTKVFNEYGAYNKFIYTHIDFLHEPLVSFNDFDKGRLYNLKTLATTTSDSIEHLYFDQLKQFDTQLGHFLRFLKDDYCFDNTAIIMTGDHGCGISWEKHIEYSLYEERLRVPLIVKYPNWAQGKLPVANSANSVFEIHKIIYSLFGEEIPDSLLSLPQYDENFKDYAFSETIMNPNHQYNKHALAIINHPYKYVCWNKIDWKNQNVEKYGDEKLFQWDQSLNTYNENKDIASQDPVTFKIFHDLSRKFISSNLEFLKNFPPQKY